MTPADIERVASEAGFTVDDGGIYVGQYLLTGTVERFAALVRAQALEDAARVCDARAKEMRGFTEEEYASEACAAAIRALAGQPGA